MRIHINTHIYKAQFAILWSQQVNQVLVVCKRNRAFKFSFRCSLSTIHAITTMSLFTSHFSSRVSKKCPKSSAFRAWATLWLWATMRGSFEGRLRCWPMALLSSQQVFWGFRQIYALVWSLSTWSLLLNVGSGGISVYSDNRYHTFLLAGKVIESFEANMFSAFQTMALLEARHAENAELFQKVVHPTHHGLYFPLKMIWEMRLILFMIYPTIPIVHCPSARWGGRPPHYLQ